MSCVLVRSKATCNAESDSVSRERSLLYNLHTNSAVAKTNTPQSLPFRWRGPFLACSVLSLPKRASSFPLALVADSMLPLPGIESKKKLFLSFTRYARSVLREREPVAGIALQRGVEVTNVSLPLIGGLCCH